MCSSISIQTWELAKGQEEGMKWMIFRQVEYSAPGLGWILKVIKAKERKIFTFPLVKERAREEMRES